MKKKQKKPQRKNRVYSAEFKVETVRRMCAGESVLGLSRILGVPRSLLYEWLAHYREDGVERLRAPGRPTLQQNVELKLTAAEQAAKRIAELERKVGQQSLEVDFLRRAFKRVKESCPANSAPGGTASTERSGQ